MFNCVVHKMVNDSQKIGNVSNSKLDSYVQCSDKFIRIGRIVIVHKIVNDSQKVSNVGNSKLDSYVQCSVVIISYA